MCSGRLLFGHRRQALSFRRRLAGQYPVPLFTPALALRWGNPVCYTSLDSEDLKEHRYANRREIESAVPPPPTTFEIIGAGIVYFAVMLCTIFNGYVAIRGRSPTTGRRIDGRLLLWCAASAVLGTILLVMVLAD
jgi:hypothetical protein